MIMMTPHRVTRRESEYSESKYSDESTGDGEPSSKRKRKEVGVRMVLPGELRWATTVCNTSWGYDDVFGQTRAGRRVCAKDLALKRWWGIES
jgi:hypothetical protein